MLRTASVSVIAIAMALALGSTASAQMMRRTRPPPIWHHPSTSTTTTTEPATPDTTTAPAAAQPPAPPPPPPPAPPAQPGVYTDAQLSSFIAASAQIDPLTRQLMATTDATQRSALVTQIRAALAANNIDAATYNAIATRASTDQALAQRLAALRAAPRG